MSPRPPQGYPVFNTPTQLARAIHQTGWRICDTASNHSLDQGQYGIDETGLALDRAGVLHTGSFPSPEAQAPTLIVTVKGVKVAFLAYTEMTNGIPLPHPQPAALCRRRRGCWCSCTSPWTERSSLVSIGYMPTWDRRPDYTVLPIGDALRRREAPAGILRASDDRTTSVVGRIPHFLGPLPGRLR